MPANPTSSRASLRELAEEAKAAIEVYHAALTEADRHHALLKMHDAKLLLHIEWSPEAILSLLSALDAAEADGLLIDALASCGAVVRPSIGGGSAFEDDEGDWNGKRYPNWRHAALEALRFEGGESSELADRLDVTVYHTGIALTASPKDDTNAKDAR